MAGLGRLTGTTDGCYGMWSLGGAVPMPPAPPPPHTRQPLLTLFQPSKGYQKYHFLDLGSVEKLSVGVHPPMPW